MAKDILTTRQAAAMLKVGGSTIKRWADEGKVVSFRTAGGHRRFPRRDLERFLRKRVVDVGGHGPSAGEDLDNWITRLTDETGYLEVTAELLGHRADAGSWWGVCQRLGPVLDELGDRWADGRLTVIDEHIASEKLRRALMFCGQNLPLPGHAPVALLTMVYGDDHTLGLSMVELTCREAGFSTRWAGRRTPVSDVARRLAEERIDLLVLSSSVVSNDAKDVKRQYLQMATAAQSAGIPVVAGGSGAWPDPLPYGDRVNDFAVFHRYLVELRQQKSALSA